MQDFDFNFNRTKKNFSFFNMVSSQNGFTVLEFIILVCMLTTLGYVGFKNFIFYQAKQLQFDAKLELGYIYSREIAVHDVYGTYTTCLTSIDYPVPTLGYYAVGFNSDEMTSIDAIMSSKEGYCGFNEYMITPEVLSKKNKNIPNPIAKIQLALGNILSATRTIYFTAAAAGNISSEIPFDIWTINQAKQLSNTTIGYEPL